MRQNHPSPIIVIQSPIDPHPHPARSSHQSLPLQSLDIDPTRDRRVKCKEFVTGGFEHQ
jgi:hypothetical protein